MMLLLYPTHARRWLLLIPVIAVVQLLFTTGLAILVSAVNVFYRDVGNLAAPRASGSGSTSRRRSTAWTWSRRDRRRATTLSRSQRLVQDQPLDLPPRPLPRRHLLRPGAGVGRPARDRAGCRSCCSALRDPGSSSGSSPPSRRSCEHAPEPARSSPSTPRTWASGTACASPRSRRVTSSARPARPAPGRRRSFWALRNVTFTGPPRRLRSASSGPTAPARARCSRCWPGSSRRPRASSRSTATSRAC